MSHSRIISINVQIADVKHAKSRRSLILITRFDLLLTDGAFRNDDEEEVEGESTSQLHFQGFLSVPKRRKVLMRVRLSYLKYVL